jgi:diphthine-ammonia ligase
VGIELTSGTQGGPRVVWQRLLLMKFVALLSGGKDSCYNILRCLDYGHELLCVGNLHPPLHLNVDETNSYMYQSAGYNMVPLIAECIGVPLICRELSGSAVTQSLDYEVTSLDEVEDLFELLKSVKVRPPSLPPSSLHCFPSFPCLF